MKKIVLIVLLTIFLVSCSKEEVTIPPEYEMLIGKWESYRFVYNNQIPGLNGNNYFVTEEYSSDSLPFKLILNLEDDSWEVFSDETFLCGDKIEGFEVHVLGSYYDIYLLKNKQRKFQISYRNGEIYFMTSIVNGYLPDYTTIYLNRIN